MVSFKKIRNIKISSQTLRFRGYFFCKVMNSKQKMFVFAIIFMLVICSNVAFKLEHSCSKFHYEEQTLEKLIRLQIFVENIKNEVDTTQSNVVEELKVLTSEREQLQTEIQNMKDDMERTKTAMEADWSTTKMQYLDGIKKYQEGITETKVSGPVMVPPVAFKSYIVTNKAMADNKVIVFSTDLHNYNNSYNNKTGVFTVPLSGIYIFFTQLSMPNQRSYYGIFVNGESVHHGWFGDEKYYRSYTLATVADVVKGDLVTIRCKAYCTGDSLYEASSVSNYFSGVLIQRK